MRLIKGRGTNIAGLVLYLAQVPFLWRDLWKLESSILLRILFMKSLTIAV
jgi:hypothetical protein